MVKTRIFIILLSLVSLTITSANKKKTLQINVTDLRTHQLQDWVGESRRTLMMSSKHAIISSFLQLLKKHKLLMAICGKVLLTPTNRNGFRIKASHYEAILVVIGA